MSIKKIRRKNSTKLINKFLSLKKAQVKVGFPAGKVSDSVLNKAAWNNYGTSRGIPERPFMKKAFADKSKVKTVTTRLGTSVLKGNIAPKQAVQQLGVAGATMVSEAIIQLSSPANAASTVAAKGSSNPLVDTGEMAQAATYKVV